MRWDSRVEHNLNNIMATWLSQSEKDGLLNLTDGGKTSVTLRFLHKFGLIIVNAMPNNKLKLGPE